MLTCLFVCLFVQILANLQYVRNQFITLTNPPISEERKRKFHWTPSGKLSEDEHKAVSCCLSICRSMLFVFMYKGFVLSVWSHDYMWACTVCYLGKKWLMTSYLKMHAEHFFSSSLSFRMPVSFPCVCQLVVNLMIEFRHIQFCSLANCQSDDVRLIIWCTCMVAYNNYN